MHEQFRKTTFTKLIKQKLMTWKRLITYRWVSCFNSPISGGIESWSLFHLKLLIKTITQNIKKENSEAGKRYAIRKKTKSRSNVVRSTY